MSNKMLISGHIASAHLTKFKQLVKLGTYHGDGEEMGTEILLDIDGSPRTRDARDASTRGPGPVMTILPHRIFQDTGKL